MKKHHSIILVLAGFLFLAPLVAKASPVDSSGMASFCYKFDTDLRHGAKSNVIIKANIIKLQDFLFAQQVLNVPSTGHFGPLTLAAVKKFQRNHGIPPTGFVGPMTRAKINALGGCGKGPFVTIYNVAGPTNLKVNEPGTWTISARDTATGTLSYSVDWGEPMAIVALPTTPQGDVPPVQTSTFNHMYSNAGTYQVTFTVRNIERRSIDQKTITVIVTNQNQPKITITSPNGGERWNSNSAQSITWNLENNTNPNAKVDIYLVVAWPESSCPAPGICAIPARAPERALYLIDKNIAWNFTYGWVVGTDIDNKIIPPGTYKMKVCMAGSKTNCDIGDESDGLFTIVDPVYESNRAPIITGISGPTTLTGDQTGTWIVNAYDPEGGPLTYSGNWSGTVLTSSSGGAWPAGSTNTFSATLPSRVGEIYTLRFTVTDNVGKTTTTSITATKN